MVHKGVVWLAPRLPSFDFLAQVAKYPFKGRLTAGSLQSCLMTLPPSGRHNPLKDKSMTGFCSSFIEGCSRDKASFYFSLFCHAFQWVVQASNSIFPKAFSMLPLNLRPNTDTSLLNIHIPPTNVLVLHYIPSLLDEIFSLHWFMKLLCFLPLNFFLQ